MEQISSSISHLKTLVGAIKKCYQLGSEDPSFKVSINQFQLNFSLYYKNSFEINRHIELVQEFFKSNFDDFVQNYSLTLTFTNSF